MERDGRGRHRACAPPPHWSTVCHSSLCSWRPPACLLLSFVVAHRRDLTILRLRGSCGGCKATRLTLVLSTQPQRRRRPATGERVGGWLVPITGPVASWLPSSSYPPFFRDSTSSTLAPSQLLQCRSSSVTERINIEIYHPDPSFQCIF